MRVIVNKEIDNHEKSIIRYRCSAFAYYLLACSSDNDGSKCKFIMIFELVDCLVAR